MTDCVRTAARGVVLTGQSTRSGSLFSDKYTEQHNITSSFLFNKKARLITMRSKPIILRLFCFGVFVVVVVVFVVVDVVFVVVDVVLLLFLSLIFILLFW